MIKRTMAVMIIALVAAAGAQAQTQAAAANPTTGKQAGTVMVRVRAIGVLPQTSSSSVSLIGGGVTVINTPAPEIDLSYFFTDHLAIEGIAASTRHAVSAVHTVLGHVDVGSVYVLPPTVTLQCYFMPHSRFSPYVGAGMRVAFFYDGQSSRSTVDTFGIGTSVVAALQAGLDYNIGGSWFANLDVKQIFLGGNARIDGGAIVAKTALDPTIVGAGVGYRF